MPAEITHEWTDPTTGVRYRATKDGLFHQREDGYWFWLSFPDSALREVLNLAGAMGNLFAESQVLAKAASERAEKIKELGLENLRLKARNDKLEGELPHLRLDLAQAIRTGEEQAARLRKIEAFGDYWYIMDARENRAAAIRHEATIRELHNFRRDVSILLGLGKEAPAFSEVQEAVDLLRSRIKELENLGGQAMLETMAMDQCAAAERVLLNEAEERIAELQSRYDALMSSHRLLKVTAEHLAKENVRLRTEASGQEGEYQRLREAFDVLDSDPLANRLIRLDALLAREEPPKGLREALFTVAGTSAPIVAWRWFREQLAMRVEPRWIDDPVPEKAPDPETIKKHAARIEALRQSPAATVEGAESVAPEPIRCDAPAPMGLRSCILQLGHPGPHADSRGNNWSWRTGV